MGSILPPGTRGEQGRCQSPCRAPPAVTTPPLDVFTDDLGAMRAITGTFEQRSCRCAPPFHGHVDLSGVRS
jgi:hypothetical protein